MLDQLKGGDFIGVKKYSEIFGKGYDCFIHDTSQYECLRGGRASKKSKSMALRTILRMHKYPTANMLVVRKVYQTLRQSCYEDLLWAMDRLGVTNQWKCTVNPMEMVRIKTGQKILFRGLDDPLKLTSISVRTGSLCWVW